VRHGNAAHNGLAPLEVVSCRR